MGKITKIDWCDSSWNPVTGCMHGCEYCYARNIAYRFGGGFRPDTVPPDKSWRNVEPDDNVMLGDFMYHASKRPSKRTPSRRWTRRKLSNVQWRH